MKSAIDSLAAALYGHLAATPDRVEELPARREGGEPRVVRTRVEEREHAITHFDQEWPNTAVMFCEPGAIAGQAFTRAYTTVIERAGFAHVFCDGRKAYTCASDCANLVDDIRDRQLRDVGGALQRYDGCRRP